MLDFRINGHLPGDSIKLPATGGSLSIEGTVWSIAPLAKVVLYCNGQVVKEFPTSGHFTGQIRVSQSGWYSLYAEGAASEYLDAAYAQAASNAVRVYVGDQPIRNRDSAEYFIRWIDKLHQMADQWPGWRSEAEKHHVFAQFDEARGIYQKLAQEAR
jgi:hypothetical protein